jgi:hypothetical protein
MVRDNRIKTYYVQSIQGRSNFSNEFTDHVLNGELLRVRYLSNFTGSLVITESGTNTIFLNISSTSGTNSWNSSSFSNTTGSFCINDNLRIGISGANISGTNALYGPIEVLYR